MNKKRRRIVFAVTAATASIPVGLLSRYLQAADLPKLSPDDPAAKSLSYAHESPEGDKRCANCQFYTGAGGENWGPCVIFPDKLVSARGLCNSWFKKAG